MTIAGRLLSGAALGALLAGGAAAQSFDDTIVVTAQRTEQSLQDVPIAVSAFSGDDLQDRQLESFTDIQFNVPNFAFSKSQFTGSTISIRGIGALAVGASTEPSTSIHINDVYINAPRLFETEFYDVERLEILRGPQGTLFGRNATGGVINVLTRKANPDETEGYIDAEYGSYESVKVNGAVNVPLSDDLAIRLAGTTIQRDGYTENVFNGEDLDDRNIYSFRVSTRWLPSDNTTVDFMASYMREDDNRMRAQKQACAAGPQQALLGCDPDGPRGFAPQDLRATFFANTSAETFALATGNPAAAAYGLFSLASGPVNGTIQPSDLRQVAYDTTPKYDAEESVFLWNIKHDFDDFSWRVNAGLGNSKISSRSDFDGGIGPLLTKPAVLGAPIGFGGLPGVDALIPNGMFPVSNFNSGIFGSDGLTGVISGDIQSSSSRYQAIDWSIGETDYWSIETLFNTDFDGGFNFLLGGSYARSNGYADYAVASSGLDYFAYTLGTLSAAGAGAPGAPTQAYSFYTPFFYNDADDNFLKSWSLFGETYIDFSDTLKLTVGVRHNWDDKGVRQRGNLLESASSTNPAILMGVPPIVPIGTPSVRPLLDANELVQCVPLGSFCADGGVNDFQVVEAAFNATTGRAVLQWTPTDGAQFYASYTRGYKPGGFNPRTLFSTVPLTFEPEQIDAFEGGVKLTGSHIRANLTGFFYDYGGLQVSRIVSNTSVNDNINAKVYGIEGEFLWQPDDRWTFNLNGAYLHTKIGDFATIDVRDPLGSGDPTQNILLADITNGSNCVLQLNGGPNIINPAVTLASLSPALAMAAPALAAGFDNLTASPFSICSSLNGVLNAAQLPLGPMGALISLNQALGTNFQVIDGIATTVTGNELPGSPTFQIAGGVQYVFDFGENHTLTPRFDAYYQTEMYTNIFNTEHDRINGYAYVNAQLKFQPKEGNWYVRAFVQNLTNNDAITGTFDSGQGAGNFQNLFILEPRRWGFGMGMTF